MEPMILFSDLHLKPESEEVCFQVLEGIRLEATRRGIAVGFLGDFWHMRYHVPVYLLNRVYAELKLWHAADIRLAMIPGNHDQVDVVGRNALEVFEAFPNIAVLTDPGELPTVPGVFWIPFRRSPDEVKVALDQARAAECPIICAHLPLRGAFQNNSRADTDGLSVGMFRGFKKVFLGHYHKRQEFVGGLAAYIGSPYQTRADEYGQDKGFVVWNGQSLEWVTTLWGKRYHRFDGKPTPADLAGIQTGDSVKVVVETELDAEVIRKTYLGLGSELVVEAKQADGIGPRLGLGKGTSLYEYAQAWAKENAEELLEQGLDDGQEVMSAFEEIWSAS